MPRLERLPATVGGDMQAARDEHGIDAEARRAGDVGVHAVADGKNLARRHGIS